MPLILGTNSIKDTGYNVANSLRFNSGSADSLQITPSSAGSLLKWTFSTWVKRSKLSGGQQLLSAGPRSGGTVEDQLYILDGGEINWYDGTSATHVRRSSNLFRDPSAWYHFVFVWDTANGTANNRARIYVNGSEITYGTQTTISQNANSKINGTGQHRIGAIGTVSGEEFNGYICETVFVNNQALAPTDFGEFDSDTPNVWKPKNVSGLTFGTNGFYLDFEDSSALGNDAAGSNNFTVNNLTAVDQSIDTCTNNFATMNPLDNFYSGNTFSEGNTKIVTPTSSSTFNTATFGLSSGKWYWEVNYSAKSNTNAAMIGISEVPTVSASVILGYSSNYKNVGYLGSNGNTYITGNGGSSYGNTYDVGDIIGVYLDLDNNKLYFSKNGTLQNSGTGVSITAPASTGTGVYFPALGDGGTPTTTSLTFLVNFGSPAYAISSSNTDDNGYGNFEYSPNITGDGAAKKFYTINTKNLAEFG